MARRLPVRYDLWRHPRAAMRGATVLNWTVTKAALRGGRRDVASALAPQRPGERPWSVVHRGKLRRTEAIATWGWEALVAGLPYRSMGPFRASPVAPVSKKDTKSAE